MTVEIIQTYSRWDDLDFQWDLKTNLEKKNIILKSGSLLKILSYSRKKNLNFLFKIFARESEINNSKHKEKWLFKL